MPPLGKRAVNSAALAVVLCIGLTTPVFGEPEITEKIVFYEIEGQSGRELKDQMGALGPKGRWARTEWRVNWSSDCKLSVKLTFIYPKLKSPNSLSDDLLSRWDRMMDALIKHENGHADITLRAARQIEDAKCVNADEIFDNGNRLNAKYDEDNRHGYTEGVRLSDD